MNKKQIEVFLDDERISYGKYASVSKEPDRNGSEYYLSDLLLKFQDKLASEDKQPQEADISQNISKQSGLFVGLLDMLEKEGGNRFINKDDIVEKYLANI